MLNHRTGCYGDRIPARCIVCLYGIGCYILLLFKHAIDLFAKGMYGSCERGILFIAYGISAMWLVWAAYRFTTNIKPHNTGWSFECIIKYKLCAFQVIEVIRHPHDKAESKYNTDVGISKEDEERYQKLQTENEELQKLIVQVSEFGIYDLHKIMVLAFCD